MDLFNGLNNYFNNKKDYIYNIPSYSVAPLQPNNEDIMKADSGASRTYLREKHIKYLKYVKLLTNGPKATLPNNTIIQASVQGRLPLHNYLSPISLVYPDLNNESLLSIGQLCDDDCIAIFDKKYLSIIKNKKIILRGNHNLRDGL